jgi:hypothetical protein
MFKKKFSKLGIVMSSFIVSGILSSALVIASPVSTGTASPLYINNSVGYMNGEVQADVDNDSCYGKTEVSKAAVSVISVSVTCEKQATGATLPGGGTSYGYNTTFVERYGGVSECRSVTVFAAHQVQVSGSSYVRYSSVSQTYY